MSKILGIDLGTTNSVCSIYENGKEKVIINAEGNRTTPSVVAFADGTFLVGQEAKNAEVTHPGSSVSSVKRYMGSVKKFKVGDKELDATQISALILEKLKNDAETFLGEKIQSCIISVPANFDEIQRGCTIRAAQLAGLNVLRTINEPSAAAIAFGVDKQKENSNVLVFDMGGGTLDVSIVNINNNVMQVVSTSGINNLGGDDIDNAIVDLLVSEFYDETKINLKENDKAMARLKQAAEEAKKALTLKKEHTIHIPYITSSPEENIDRLLTRDELDNIARYIFKKIKTPINRAVSDAKLTFDDIDEVLLVGGSTRMPIVQTLVEEITGKQPRKTVSPDESISIGCAIQGDILAGGTPIEFTDITSLSLSMMSASGLVNVLIPRNTKIPCEITKQFTTSSDYQTDVKLSVYQGEREFANDNTKIGEFILSGLTPAKKGTTKVNVTFYVDESCILHVTAVEDGTDNKKEISVDNYFKLSANEIENTIKIANYFKEKDANRKQVLEEKQNSKLIFEAIDSILNADVELTDDEQEQLESFRELESEFLKSETPSVADVSAMASKNATIKAMIMDIKERISDDMFEEDEEE